MVVLYLIKYETNRFNSRYYLYTYDKTWNLFSINGVNGRVKLVKHIDYNLLSFY